jgi:hypothetical protein
VLSTPTSRPPLRPNAIESDLVAAHNRTVMTVTMTDSSGRDGADRDERGQGDGAAGHVTTTPR